MKPSFAEDNRILFLVEKLEKKVELGESDIQELFQGAGKNPELMKSLIEFVRDSRKNKNKGREQLGLKKRVWSKLKIFCQTFMRCEKSEESDQLPLGGSQCKKLK